MGISAVDAPRAFSMGISAVVRGTKQRLQELFCANSRSTSSQDAFEKLPVDIMHHIYSILPLRDAAHAACVSHGFLLLWRCYSNLKLDVGTLGLAHKKYEDWEIFLIDIVDRILRNHSGNGVETLDLGLLCCKNIDPSYLDRWLQIVVRLGIKQLNLQMTTFKKKEYSFPCSVLSDDAAASSIRSICLGGCAFRPTPTLGCLRRLKALSLFCVQITDEGLGHLLSKSFALEHIYLYECNEIICLKIPCMLQQLQVLTVKMCERLQVVEINAPRLSSFHFNGNLVKISVVDPSPLRDVSFSSPCRSRMLSYARTRLPSITRNVTSLTLLSYAEDVNIPMLHSKFPRLKKLEVKIKRPQDVMCLVSFLDASPALDSFILHVDVNVMRPDSVVGGENAADDPRWKPQCRHDCLREVRIIGFSSEKNLVQFVIYIVESTPRLESITLDTTFLSGRSCDINDKSRKMKTWCSMMTEGCIAEAHRAVKVANRYIAERVPSGVS
ncbi:hypothetical protein D1007_48753 [Hordeum vulgare]|nr:hypothetical protein D1007_48753 [Hordeum vulgare]